MLVHDKRHTLNQSHGAAPQSGESGFVAQSFAVTLAVTVAYMTACSHFHWGYLGVWNGILVFFVSRAAQNGTRAVVVHMMGPGGPARHQQAQEDQPLLGPQQEGGAGNGGNGGLTGRQK
jgi:hypothetical protein